jgi:3-dehydroquinate dehydratase/shikimate dehydrogenase
MLFLSLAQPEQALQHACALELRLDLFPSIDLSYVKGVLQNAAHPVLLTLRSRSQGGAFQGTEPEQEACIERLLALEPPFFDLEHTMRSSFLQRVLRRHSKTQFILSHHCFQEEAADLGALYRSMAHYPAFGYKIAIMTRTANEGLQALLFARAHPKTSVICMGERGAFARVLGAIACNSLHYASAGVATGPGQLSLAEWKEVYHYPLLDEKTAVYGLIGDPVAHSVGHLHHNAVFRKRALNAVYVKMAVRPEELADFFPLAHALGVRGLSVTMPLKEAVLPFLDEIEPAAQRIGAVNTLLFKEGKIAGANTDGAGALDALEQTTAVRGKKVVLLGAGGAARAIAYEAVARGADVLILNRTRARAQRAAADVGCAFGGLEDLPPSYDVLINCSPPPLSIDAQTIAPGTIAMDIVYAPRETEFLQAAARRGCTLIYGEEMFKRQAARQTALWVGA